MASAAALILAVSAQAGAAPAGPSIDAGPAVLQAPALLALAAVQDPPVPKPDVDVTVTTERTVWYADPVWITIGVLAAILVIGLIVAASRSGGGSTTVIK
jgi:hypothetical protein